ncbi:hypothetical protein IAQ61_009330 [Plenodomus lingam]|uniref:uncharacterized protein n=1 Tax=Leptosphaeria maculans TaxID=5022 RepID=UPI00332E5C6F|nr:hypothetical protein IAQ61_009330 [Plenodomus lingam]
MSLHDQQSPSAMSHHALPDPPSNPSRLLHADCFSRKPPTLPVFLIEHLRRVTVSSLHGFHNATKHCSLCERPMCDAPWWPPPGIPRQRLKSVMAEVERAKNAFAAKLQKTAFDGVPSLNWQSFKVMWKTTPDHTCASGYCECPIQILTPGCKHYVGHRCLETWIYAGQNHCVKCNTIWFQPTPLVRTMMGETYEWPTQRRHWGNDLRWRNMDPAMPVNGDTLQRQVVKMNEERKRNLKRRAEGGVDYDTLVQEAAQRAADEEDRAKRSEPIDIIYPRGRSPTRTFFLLTAWGHDFRAAIINSHHPPFSTVRPCTILREILVLLAAYVEMVPFGPVINSISPGMTVPLSTAAA